MTLGPILKGYYSFSGDVTSSTCSEMSEPLEPLQENTVSSEMSEPLDPLLTVTVSSELEENLPALLILEGINLVSGAWSDFQPSDVIVTRQGNVYFGTTGINGVTGLAGFPGLIGVRGDTGLVGATGTIGITGIAPQGLTGIMGITGLVGLDGITGLIGATGFVTRGVLGSDGGALAGSTGLQGFTGFIGITGLVVLGTTGLIGDTGIVVGSTGIIGLAGISVGGATGLQGVTGLDMAGPTGLRGITGSRGIDGPVVVNSLFTQRSLGTSLTYTLPGNTLSVDEQHLELVAWGVTTSNGSSTPITLTLGGSTIFNRSLSGTNGAPFSIRGVIIRIGATTQECIMSAISGSGEVWAQRASTSVNLASNQDIVISTTSSAAIIETLLVRRLRQV